MGKNQNDKQENGADDKSRTGTRAGGTDDRNRAGTERSSADHVNPGGTERNSVNHVNPGGTNPDETKAAKGKKSLLGQIIRFGFVGGSSFLIDYLVMIGLTELAGINYLVSSGISFTISVIYNYVMSIIWVFNVKKEKQGVVAFVIFVVLSAIGLLINQLLMWVLVDKAGIFYMLSKIAATAVVMVYNFVTRKLFLEK